MIKFLVLWVGLFSSIAVHSQTIDPGDGSSPSSSLNAPSPEKIAITAGGVDIRTGRHTYSSKDLVTGTGFTFERIMPNPILGQVQPMGNFSHNWQISLVVQPIILDGASGYDYIANVNYGGRSQTFQKIHGQDPVFRQKSQNDFTRLTTTTSGPALGTVYVYQSTDGTIVNFRPLSNNECATAAFFCAFPSSIIEPNGTRHLFEYETVAGVNITRLRSVNSSTGYSLLLEYGILHDTNRLITKACLLNRKESVKPTNNACPSTNLMESNYTYQTVDNRKMLTNVTQSEHGAETFAYSDVVSGQSYKMIYKKAGQVFPWMTNSFEYSNTSDGVEVSIVKHQSFADGNSYTYLYDFTPVDSYAAVSGGIYRDAENNITRIKYDFPPTPYSFNPPWVAGGGGYRPVNYGDVVYQVTPGPTQITDPLGRTTINDYCDPNAMANLPSNENNRCLVTRLQSITSPEGNKTYLKYGINDNLIEVRKVAKPGTGIADVITKATYDVVACSNYNSAKVCSKPTTITDAKGQVTNYVYDTTHGGVLSETGPADANGVRPQKRYEYAAKYAWAKNASGTYTQEVTPIWVVAKESSCRTSAATGNPASPCAAGLTDEVRTTYDYEQGNAAKGSNILLLGTVVTAANAAGALESRRTCFSYDSNGRKISETKPKAGLAACP